VSHSILLFRSHLLTSCSRGRKILRKFQDDTLSNPAEEPEASGEDLQLRRQVGYEAHRPLTRSSIKPRLLFKEEIQRRKVEKGETDEEEAVTDIEVPVATPSRRKGKMMMQLADSLQEATPPPTVPKSKRGKLVYSEFARSIANSLQKSPSTRGCASSRRIAQAARPAESRSAAVRRWRVMLTSAQGGTKRQRQRQLRMRLRRLYPTSRHLCRLTLELALHLRS
jgi:hypothetical protein